jgi:quinol monooxygenase YgiN
MDPVILNVHIEAATGQEDELGGQLRILVNSTRLGAGVSYLRAASGSQNPFKFMFYERFKSQAVLDAHLATPHFKAFEAGRAAHHPDPIASIAMTTWRAIA